jgi:predicted transcriptional regulator
VTTAHVATVPPDAVLGEPTAGDLMRPAPLTVDAATSALLVHAQLVQGPAEVALVTRRGVPAGLVDELHLHRAALRALLTEQRGDDLTTVGACLPHRCIRIPVQAPLATVAERLLRSPLRAALVTDGGTVVGVITATDLLRGLATPGRRFTAHRSTADH